MQNTNNFERITERYHALTQQLGAGIFEDNQLYVKLTKELAELKPVAETIFKFQKAQQEWEAVTALLADPTLDEELKTLAQNERETLKGTLEALDMAIKLLLLPKDEADKKNVILEIRAGTGGDEAALFAADLLRMYQRYAERMGWRFEMMTLNDIGIGGIKEVQASILGQDVFAHLKFESGVHRVQRIPVTESGGRIHTSAATVAVLPEAEDVDIIIEDKDLKIDVYRSSGPGGQSVNTTDSAVRITHLPTGLVVHQQDEKSQHKNRAKAMKILRARLYELERQKQDAERAENRKSQIGSGDRSERIRTYNFPQNRVTDHRINLTVHKLQHVLDGSALEELIHALVAHDQLERLAAFRDDG